MPVAIVCNSLHLINSPCLLYMLHRVMTKQNSLQANLDRSSNVFSWFYILKTKENAIKKYFITILQPLKIKSQYFKTFNLNNNLSPLTLTINIKNLVFPQSFVVLYVGRVNTQSVFVTVKIILKKSGKMLLKYCYLLECNILRFNIYCCDLFICIRLLLFAL